MEERLKQIGSRRVFSGRIFSVRQDIVELDGERRTLDVVDHPGSYCILARPARDTVVLIRQYRYAIGQMLWELPAGKAEPGEEPSEGALRELREETGYRAARIEPILRLYMTPGFCSEALRFYMAQDLTPGPTEFDAEEQIESRIVSVSDGLDMLSKGEIVDAKTAVGLLWLDRFYRE
ncbi:MAG: NUDIX hydrolase [Candidatus Eremiobacteraeota bacterium]|nr:NUDIX hydrolase [Candidatus Eremiobacteraeota bacterium]